MPTERAFNLKYHAKRKSRTNDKSLKRICIRFRVYLKSPDKVIVNDSKEGFLFTYPMQTLESRLPTTVLETRARYLVPKYCYLF